MTEYSIPSMADLYMTKTKEGLVAEATRFPTFPSGYYLLKVSGYSIRPTEEDIAKLADDPEAKEKEAWVTRHRAHLTITAFHKAENGKEERRAGTIYSDVSWWEKRSESTGRLDGQSQLWGQLVEALDMGDKSVGEVLEAATKYPLDGYVAELFKFPDGSYKTAKTVEERAQFTKDGGEPSNRLRSVRRMKY